MVMHKVEVRKGPFGRGIYAAEQINPGDAVWELSGNDLCREFTKEDIDNWPDLEQKAKLLMYSYMIGEDRYLSTWDPEAEDPSYFFNHTCDPNCGYINDDLLVAIRTIQPGEHVAYDYGFTETEMSFHAGMQCRCGAPTCRGVITGREYRSRKWVKQWYKCLTSHLKNRVDALNYHHPGVYRRRATVGRGDGMYAGKTIKKGEVVGVFTGRVVSTEELEEYDEEELHFSLQLDDEIWMVPGPLKPGSEVTEYVNHSCEANAGMLDSVIFVALRDIRNGEEITLDYGTLNNGTSQLAADNFQCLCGASQCRSNVSTHDWKLPAVQDRYWPFFPPFVKKRIKSEKKSNGAKNNGVEHASAQPH